MYLGVFVFSYNDTSYGRFRVYSNNLLNLHPFQDPSPNSVSVWSTGEDSNFSIAVTVLFVALKTMVLAQQLKAGSAECWTLLETELREEKLFCPKFGSEPHEKQ